MFCALDVENQVVNLLEKEITESSRIRPPFHCPACGSEVRLKRGYVKSSHFAHLSLRNCQAWSENESVQHLDLKKAFYHWAKKGNKVEVERYLPTLRQTPDLLINDKIAIEIQCSRLSLRRLKERTENYRGHGYQVFWMMGKDLWLGQSISPLQKDLLYFSKNIGFYYWECDLQKRVLRLKYLIHESLTGRLAFLSQEFSFQKSEFLEALRFPFRRQRVCRMQLVPLPEIKNYIQRQLYYQVPKWLKIQASYYLQGKNLLEEDFPIHWTPLGLNLLTEQKMTNFCQIKRELSLYYERYVNYHREHSRERFVYSPAYYLRE